MAPWLTWLQQNDGLGTWLGGLITAAALVWALVTARSDARRANERAAANLLAADDALAAIQEHLEKLTDGRTAFDDMFDHTEGWLSVAPFERFRLEMQEIDMSILPSQWSRRDLRRARAVIEETTPAVAAALDPTQGKSISSADLAQVAREIRRCRQTLSPDLAARTPLAWLRGVGARQDGLRPERLGKFD